MTNLGYFGQKNTYIHPNLTVRIMRYHDTTLCILFRTHTPNLDSKRTQKFFWGHVSNTWWSQIHNKYKLSIEINTTYDKNLDLPN